MLSKKKCGTILLVFCGATPIYRDTFEQIDAMPKIIHHAREEAKIIPNIHDMQKMI